MSTRTPTLVKLDFPEKLIQTGKGAGADALLKRLKSLHQKLAALEQDFTDTRSLDPVKKPLINAIILHHKDRGVKAYAACCLADLLRLYAPDAPYTGEELRDIFQFFSHQLRSNLKQTVSNVRPLAPSKNKANEASQSQSQSQQTSQRITDVPYFTEYCYLLQSLATIKSIVLVCDVPGGDDLIVGYFDGFMELVRADMNKTLIRHLVDILVACVEESSSIPSGVMDILIEQFKENASKPETPSFQLAVDVCNQTADRLQRHVLAHFSAIQLAHGRSPSADDLTALEESHNLLLTMFQYCPGLLLNVVPLLEENLRAADEVPLRQQSTRTLGTMFGARPTVGTATDITRAYPSAWRAWLGRKVDKAVPVRLAWVEATKDILVNHPELRGELEPGLVDRIHDADEKVRASICKVIGTLDYETALRHVSRSTLIAVGGRMSDKKSSVRAESCSAMAKLWTLAYSEIETNSEEAVEQFGWIPEMMLHSLFKKDATLDLRAQITSTMKNHVLPLPKNDDEQAWVDRLLLVASHVDEPAFKALERLTGLRGFAKGASPYKAFIDFCEENNGGVIDGDVKQVQTRLEFVINAIAHQLFADHEKAKKDLQAFADANDARLYKLFRICADFQTDVKAMIKSRNELLRRIEQSHTNILETFTVLLDSASWMVINHSSIPPLIKRLQRPDPGLLGSADVAAKFLSLIAKEGAPMFKSHVDELVIVMADPKNHKLSEVALQGLAAVCKWNPTCAPSDKRPVERAVKIVMEGTPRQAKFASRFLASSRNPESCGKLIDKMREALPKATAERRVVYLTALSEMARSASKAFNERSEKILEFVKDKVLFAESPSAKVDESEEWVDEAELDDHEQAKIVGMRICTHHLLSRAKDPEALDLVQSTLEMFASVLRNDGLFDEKIAEGGRARCHFRLRAGLCLLKLANVRVFDRAMTEHFEVITYLIQDPIYQVRYRFLLKLGEALPAQRLMPRWNVIPALTAKDPEDENIVLGKSIMAATLRQCSKLPQDDRVERIEMPLARLLLMLTHHPDLTWDGPGLKDIARFIELFLDCVATKENVSLLFHIALKLKTVRDATNDQNDNLYRLSELAQLIIKNRASVHGWALTTYPGKIKLPRDIFHNLTDHEAVQRVVKTTYLPEETAKWAQSLGKKHINSAGPSRKAEPSSTSAEGKKRTKPVRAASRKKRRSDARDESLDETDSEDEDEDGDGDEDEGNAKESDEEEEEEEVGDGEPVLGRGGRRGAKTKAKKAAKAKDKTAKAMKNGKSPKKDEKMDVDEDSSELSEEE